VFDEEKKSFSVKINNKIFSFVFVCVSTANAACFFHCFGAKAWKMNWRKFSFLFVLCSFLRENFFHSFTNINFLNEKRKLKMKHRMDDKFGDEKICLLGVNPSCYISFPIFFYSRHKTSSS
jgi:hypothetical protein